MAQLFELLAADTLINCHLWASFSGLTWAFMTWVALVALPYSIALHTSLARFQGFLFMVTTHNSTALKENGMKEDIFNFSSFRSKIFVSGRQTQKVHVYNHNFSISFFSSPDIHQSQYLDRCQTIGINSSLICAFSALHFLYPSYHSKNLSLSSQ